MVRCNTACVLREGLSCCWFVSDLSSTALLAAALHAAHEDVQVMIYFRVADVHAGHGLPGAQAKPRAGTQRCVPCCTHSGSGLRLLTMYCAMMAPLAISMCTVSM
jgi:hypothetical protein